MTSVDNIVRTASQAQGCVPQPLCFGTCLGPQAPSITSRRQFSNWLSKDTQDQGRGLSDPGLSDPLTVSNQDTIRDGFSIANYSHE